MYPFLDRAAHKTSSSKIGTFPFSNRSWSTASWSERPSWEQRRCTPQGKIRMTSPQTTHVKTELRTPGTNSSRPKPLQFQKTQPLKSKPLRIILSPLSMKTYASPWGRSTKQGVSGLQRFMLFSIMLITFARRDLWTPTWSVRAAPVLIRMLSSRPNALFPKRFPQCMCTAWASTSRVSKRERERERER